ncbi:MAG: hypothetical protein QM770_10780 [Tepidisphaeraceae bacterium]
MGGEAVPMSFRTIDDQDVWALLGDAHRPEDFQRVAILKLAGPSEITAWDADGSWSIPISDELLEVFQLLKNAASGYVLVAERLFRECYLAPERDATDYLQYQKERTDEEYGPAKQ